MALLFAWPAAAEVVVFRDQNGQLHFVDDTTKVPAEYRHRARTLDRGESLGRFDVPDEDTQANQRKPVIAPERDLTEALQPEPAQTPVLIKGNRVLVPVEVAMGSRVAKLSLLLDTGATSTVLHRTSLDGLELPQGKRYKARVAGGGIVYSHKIKFRHIKVGPHQIDKASAMVIDLEGSKQPFDGMLGMDFLKHHPYRINFKDQLIYWDPVN